MNSQAARVIRHFCLATGKSENEIKRRYNTVPATRRDIVLNYLQRTTEMFKQRLQEQQDTAAMKAYIQDLIDNPPDLSGHPPTGPAATGVIPIDRRTEAQIRALAAQGIPTA